jgi:ribonuclease BN (tRNA processing enzyme)
MHKINKICKNGEPLQLETSGNLRIVFLGVGSAFTKRKRQSNFLIIQGDYHVLVDCGTLGSLALDDIGLSVTKVQCYLPTHSHADHIGGFEEIALVNRYITNSLNKPKMIIVEEYQDLLWAKSLSGGIEFCETKEGKPLQLTDFFDILRPKETVILGQKTWLYQHGPIDLVFMRTRHIPDSTTSIDEAQWCSGILVNNRVWISGDTMFDRDYPTSFSEISEVMFHDCQMFKGGVHASYSELMTLPAEVRSKMYLYHYNDNWDNPKTWVGTSDNFTGDPLQDGFLGWAQQQVAYDFS